MRRRAARRACCGRARRACSITWPATGTAGTGRLLTAAPAPEGGPAGMLRRGEASLRHHLARDWYGGSGEIIDAGAFLGASSYALGRGLEQNPRVADKAGRIHAYGLFAVWREEGQTEQ